MKNAETNTDSVMENTWLDVNVTLYWCSRNASRGWSGVNKSRPNWLHHR